ncbi:hypothetical protein ACIBCO_41460 [Streptomyces violascens]|uniref:hypothetical protein n=1 Tax=Streptomyces violascens TaxID=67381 RepID=UPI0037B79ABA
MIDRQHRVKPFITFVIGVFLTLVAILLLAWYNVAVLNDSEISRLEAGGAANTSPFEEIAVFLIPGLGVLGLIFVAISIAVWSTQKKT